MNPTAIAFWIFTTAVGYLVIPSLYGAVIGLALGAGLSLVASI